jgi:Sulfite exporter TauE/SafE
MSIGIIAAALAVVSGSIIGILLGLIGSGGSILAVPLLVYLVGVPSVHVAIGTGAIAVALNAAFGLAGHARLGTVKRGLILDDVYELSVGHDDIPQGPMKSLGWICSISVVGLNYGPLGRGDTRYTT